MQFILQDEITIAFVEAVRWFFGTKEYTKEWEWSSDKEKRRIEIVDSWPETEQEFPTVVLNSMPTGTSEELGFGQALERIKNDDGEDIGQFFGGRIDFDISFEIATYSKRETHRISDILTLGLGSLKTIPDRVMKDSYNNLIPLTPMVRLSAETQRQITDGTYIFTRTLSQKWQSYWKEEAIYSETVLEFLTTAEREKIDDRDETMEIEF